MCELMRRLSRSEVTVCRINERAAEVVVKHTAPYVRYKSAALCLKNAGELDLDCERNKQRIEFGCMVSSLLLFFVVVLLWALRY